MIKMGKEKEMGVFELAKLFKEEVMIVSKEEKKMIEDYRKSKSYMDKDVFNICLDVIYPNRFGMIENG